MIKGIIYDTVYHAKNADWSSNALKGSISRHKYTRKLLTATTALTKSEYAALLGISETLTDESGNTSPNPRYTELSIAYVLNKCAAMVGDDFDIVDEATGTVTVPDYVVDITGLVLVSTGL